MQDLSRRAVLIQPAAWLAAGQVSSGALEERLAPPQGQVDVVLDSDTYNEIDDQFAVAYALLSRERMKVEAVYAAPFLNERSSSPADGMQKSYEEILRILKRLNLSPQGFAFAGSERFLPAAGKPVDSPAARDLIQRALQTRSKPLYVMAIGAPTNVSSALLLEPRIKNRIVVVWLGGQPLEWHTASEFNLKQDLHASRTLYDCGVPLIQIPAKNVSEHLRTTTLEIEHFLKGKSPIADYLCSEFHAYAKSKAPQGDYPWSKVIWDIAAVAWLVRPDWVPSRIVFSPVLTDELKYRLQVGRHKMRIAIDVHRDPIFDDLFRKLAAV